MLGRIEPRGGSIVVVLIGLGLGITRVSEPDFVTVGIGLGGAVVGGGGGADEFAGAVIGGRAGAAIGGRADAATTAPAPAKPPPTLTMVDFVRGVLVNDIGVWFSELESVRAVFMFPLQAVWSRK